MFNLDEKKIRASKFEMLLARLFGRKAIVDGWTFYFFRNKVYVFSQPPAA
jgi:hypothetical protein